MVADDDDSIYSEHLPWITFKVIFSTEKLIEKIREHPILYDLFNSDYKILKQKNEIWNELFTSFEGTNGKEKYVYYCTSLLETLF